MNMTPKCPYCGAEMLYFERRTKGYGFMGYYLCSACKSRAPRIDNNGIDAADIKAAALSAAVQRYVEPNRILSADDLTQMEGDPVFIQQGDGDEFWAMIEDGKPIIGECDPYFQNLTMPPPLHDPAGHFGLHVLGWRAMKRRPTDEERQSVAWEESE